MTLNNMQLSDFNFDLPEKYIAKYPSEIRSGSKLLCLSRDIGEVNHRKFKQLPDLLNDQDLLVFNDSKVIPARLFGQKTTQGKVEILIERIIDPQTAIAHIKASKAPKPGTTIILENEEIAVQERHGDLFQLHFPNGNIEQVLQQQGLIPLPPYLNREVEDLDQERYQTVYCKDHGSVAAPTAGLHFDEHIFKKLAENNIPQAFLTLHVGAGTFQTIRHEDLSQHKMHKERITVPEAVCEQIRQCKARGGRVVAVGTTTVRSLESAAKTGELQAFSGETDLFITPGYKFKVVDALITNFHLPKSSLLMLVSAFAGYEHVMQAYQQAIANDYRFFSYGDAMFCY